MAGNLELDLRLEKRAPLKTELFDVAVGARRDIPACRNAHGACMNADPNGKKAARIFDRDGHLKTHLREINERRDGALSFPSGREIRKGILILQEHEPEPDPDIEEFEKAQTAAQREGEARTACLQPRGRIGFHRSHAKVEITDDLDRPRLPLSRLTSLAFLRFPPSLSNQSEPG